jgi:CheY-like chemotaxis protein
VTPGFPDLRGLRVFVVEDEFVVLVQLEDMLTELGCDVVGSASRLGDALAMLPERVIDVAVLDINLGGAKVYPVAEILAARNVPILFSTGYGNVGVSEPWSSRPILQKPYRIDQLAEALRQVTARSQAS